MNEKKTPAIILAEFKLEVTPKMLKAPQFNLLIKFTDAYNMKFPQTKTTMIETLTDAFGDKKTADVLAAVKAKDMKVKKIATELEAAQLQMWLSSGKSVDDVYQLMKLPFSKTVNYFTGNPLSPVWIAYLNTFSIQNSEKVLKMLSTMTTQFRDRPMMQILQAAEKFPNMEKIAAKLQLQLTEKVLATEVSPREAFIVTSHCWGFSSRLSGVYEVVDLCGRFQQEAPWKGGNVVLGTT
ncbi:hypothetical protein P3T76_010339 [Phytophthora citrophthora]|uniref:RxLR effector protein n=1 Tax=Phytophthora citrophthora TaxID=4793 RepID=A0AAD9GC52_9STRA|nr:hypothetical protein P3T76_010339 [Phytophthora citrophthora]